MNKCFLFHKWDYVYDTFTDTFLCEKLTRHYIKFRICKRCGKAMEYYCCMMDEGWSPMDAVETKILKSKIKWNNGLNGYLIEKEC